MFDIIEIQGMNYKHVCHCLTSRKKCLTLSYFKQSITRMLGMSNFKESIIKMFDMSDFKELITNVITKMFDIVLLQGVNFKIF